MSKVMGTTAVAAICQVSTRTVSKWIDGGKLKGYRVPGSKHRRTTPESLLEFLSQHDMPEDMRAAVRELK